jgi:hypothetical protein
MPKQKTKPASSKPSLIGWREIISLPDLNIGPLIAKIDTGARSAALHAEDIKRVGKRVRFKVRIDDHIYRCDLPLHGERKVKNSSGHSETRAVIVSRVKVGRDIFEAEITLTDRTDMGVPMLLGRATVRGRYVVHPGRSFLLSRNRQKSQ